MYRSRERGASQAGAWFSSVGDGGKSVDVINTFFNSLMYQPSTLIAAIIVIGALAYIGTIAISPSNIELRRLVGYLTSIALVVIGVGSFFFGASK